METAPTEDDIDGDLGHDQRPVIDNHSSSGTAEDTQIELPPRRTMASSTQQTFQCTSCPRYFTTGRGLGRHQAAHNRQEVSAADSISTNTASSISAVDTSAIDSTVRANLPPFLPVNPIPTQAYNNIPGADFANSINAIYDEIITWRKNLF